MLIFVSANLFRFFLKKICFFGCCLCLSDFFIENLSLYGMVLAHIVAENEMLFFNNPFGVFYCILTLIWPLSYFMTDISIYCSQKSRSLSLKTPSLCVYSICACPCGLTDDGKLGSIALYNSKKISF